MVERQFEAELERMFNQPPRLADNDAFTRRVTQRLDRSWRLRALGITTAGAIGGVIAISQTVGTGFGLRVREASSETNNALGSLYQQAMAQTPLLEVGGYDLSATMFWAVSAVVVMIAGVGAMRLFEEA